MSDLSIVEITDSSIKINKLDSVLEENNKRKLSNDDDLEDSMAGKKICRDTENFEDSSIIVEPTLTESLNDDSQIEENVLEKNIDENKPDIEVKNNNSDNIEQSAIIEEEKIDDSLENDNDEDSIIDDEYDDDILMMRAMKNLTNQPSNLPKVEDDEPIALDSDSDDSSEEEISQENENIEEQSNIDLNEEYADEESLLSLQKRLMRYNPKFYFARRLVKKSIKTLVMHRSNVNNEKKRLKQMKLKSDESELTDQIKKRNEKSIDINNMSTDEKCDIISKENQKITENEILEKKVDDNPVENVDLEKKSNNEKVDVMIGENLKIIQEDKEIEDTKLDDSNSSEINNLLSEISRSTVDEIMARYIFHNSDNSSVVTTDEFSEQLFYCLQENKKDIESLQRIWNEKIHMKFKMREIMERIRRHRVISEIETFGIKPAQENQACTNMPSSKSSTTNSENEHYDRSSKLSSQSVNRLIQDVRENVLKKEKQRIEDMTSNLNESYDESHSFGSNHQGRQGQIIDVQSIINDFRQKNPQEIPRRGRRMKSSFPNTYLMSNQQQQSYNKCEDKKIASIDHNSAVKSSVGFPEVSLLPVNNFYKNHSPQYGQKSSLLQSILTKQPNKNSSAIQSNNKSSTLARLLTAPEKSFQSPSRSMMQQNSKVHNNGEITITPIAGTSRRHMIDDEENSEPPLVIDESDDFDMSDRNASGSDLLCQGCRRNKALFMCAGCSRQWYCSKECQELAWDDHAESCMV